jgi:hypothetical protein
MSKTTDKPTVHPLAQPAYRVTWRWATKDTWHDRGFFASIADAEAHVAKIVADKGANAVTSILKFEASR